MKINEIKYDINVPLRVDEIIFLYNNSGIKRPTEDVNRISKMFENSNLIISAWDHNELIGISRSVTDFSYCCYLSDLVVSREYQKMGIGKRLVEMTKNHIGEYVMLLLLSSPEAMEYYPKIGFEQIQNGYIIKRSK